MVLKTDYVKCIGLSRQFVSITQCNIINVKWHNTDLEWRMQCHYLSQSVMCVPQTDNGRELSNETLSHVARSLTLWEFLMLKLGRGRANAEQARIAEILTEFSELHTKVKSVSRHVLMLATDDGLKAEDDKHVMVKIFFLDSDCGKLDDLI